MWKGETKERRDFEGPCSVVWGTSVYVSDVALIVREAAYCPLLMPGECNLQCCWNN